MRGFLLLVLVAAWLWLPRLRPREAAPGAALVVAVGACALPVAAGLDADDPWWDWRSWSWFGAGKEVTFNWEHSYGPLTWPREGTTLLNVKSDDPLYWKTATLGRFDRFGWVRSSAGAESPRAAQVPYARTRPGRRWRYGELNPRWDERFKVTVRGLRTDFVVGAGTTYQVLGAGATVGSSDGTTVKLEGPLERGDSYTVRAYVPNPTAYQLRHAPADYPTALTEYTAVFLPRWGESALERGVDPEPTPERRPVIVPMRGDPLSGSPAASRRLLGSPYRRMYRLALRVTGGAPTAYDAVKRLERHLERSYRYGERPPRHDLPLSAFLFQDRFGYCQQFSGAMALMLRMVGIPSRVATGFTPGSLNRDTGEYRVRDLDAHSWVEVYFTGVGWVAFDPTPPIAPAQTQLSGVDGGSAARSNAAEGRDRAGVADAERAFSRNPAPRSSGGGGVGRFAPPAALLLVAVGGAAWLVARARLARATLSRCGPADAQVRELEAALARLGWRVPTGTTLLALERRLGRAVGPAAARYVERLRAHRYAGHGGGPGPAERRALRRELGAAGGPRGRLRALLALPPAGPPRAVTASRRAAAPAPLRADRGAGGTRFRGGRPAERLFRRL